MPSNIAAKLIDGLWAHVPNKLSTFFKLSSWRAITMRIYYFRSYTCHGGVVVTAGRVSSYFVKRFSERSDACTPLSAQISRNCTNENLLSAVIPYQRKIHHHSEHTQPATVAVFLSIPTYDISYKISEEIFHDKRSHATSIINFTASKNRTAHRVQDCHPTIKLLRNPFFHNTWQLKYTSAHYVR